MKNLNNNVKTFVAMFKMNGDEVKNVEKFLVDFFGKFVTKNQVEKTVSDALLKEDFSDYITQDHVTKAVRDIDFSDYVDSDEIVEKLADTVDFSEVIDIDEVSKSVAENIDLSDHFDVAAEVENHLDDVDWSSRLDLESMVEEALENSDLESHVESVLSNMDVCTRRDVKKVIRDSVQDALTKKNAELVRLRDELDAVRAEVVGLKLRLDESEVTKSSFDFRGLGRRLRRAVTVLTNDE